MYTKKTTIYLSAENLGLAYGLLGVVCFSLTLPATHAAVSDLDPTIVGLGRALVAAVLAALLLWATRQPWPAPEHLKGLMWVASGVIIGFPWLTSWAMRLLPASHGAIVLGILPLATAITGALRMGERPSLGFWLFSVLGSVAVLAYTVMAGAGTMRWADLALLGGVIGGAIGYAEGGRLAKTLGGWQVISWALVLAAPIVVMPVLFSISQHGLTASPSAWLGFGYVSLVSQLLGFFAWYKGLALGGVARVSQVQLLQPFLTIGASALLLHETITPMMAAFALLVATSVVLGRSMPIARRKR